MFQQSSISYGEGFPRCALKIGQRKETEQSVEITTAPLPIAIIDPYNPPLPSLPHNTRPTAVTTGFPSESPEEVETWG